MKLPAWVKAGLGGKTAAPASPPQRIFTAYEERLPTNQTAIDTIAGWNSAFPPDLGLVAGTVPLFDDQRIHWAIEQFGALAGRNVLELGPLEGGHTSMLDAAGANVLAIEANKTAYLRCLVTKEIRGLRNTRFMVGDGIKWLEETDRAYDLVVASGVLYHMRDPLRLLRAIARRTTSLYLWTVCVTDDALVPNRTEMLDDVPMRLYLRSYAKVHANVDFCGGMEEQHYWLHRADILRALEALGFNTQMIEHDRPDHLHGPTFSVFARKAQAEGQAFEGGDAVASEAGDGPASNA